MGTLHEMRQAYLDRNFGEVLNISEHFNPNENELMEYLELKAKSLQKSGAFEEALGVWNVLISRNQSNAFYYGERAVCKFHLGYKSTLEDLEMAIKLEPDNGYHFACRAYIKDKLGDTEGSIDDYKRSLELDPQNEVTLNNLGLAEEKLGYTQQARSHMRQADLLAGISTEANERNETSQTAIPKPLRSSIWREVLKMISSRAGFREFLKDLFGR